MKNNILMLLTGIFGLLYFISIAEYAQEMEEMTQKRDAELERVKNLTNYLVR